MKRVVAFLSLFSSFGTLLCCALPALFVTLGLGAAFAGLVGSFPQLIWVSEHKVALFIVGALLLALGGFLQWTAREKACPADQALGVACATTRDWSKLIYLISVCIYIIGAFFAFIAPEFL